ncbi:hypothetical protein LCGC14_2604100, partial [marine sediment metagenome]
MSMYQYFTSGTFVKTIHESSFILMWIVFALTVLLGPVFCGWVCPLGSIQEWLGKLGKKLIKKKFNRLIPYRFDRVLRYLRYVMLGWVLYATAVTAKHVFADFDPYCALFRFWTGEVAITSLIILGAVLTTAEIEPDPIMDYELCTDCDDCIEKCPGDAISKDGEAGKPIFDPIKCWLMNAVEGRTFAKATEAGDTAVIENLQKTVFMLSEATPATCICGEGCLASCPIDNRI